MIRFLALAPIFTAACASEQGLTGMSDADGARGPSIVVTPETISYGTILQADGSVVKTITVKSVGDVELDVSSITLEDETGSFTLLDFDGPFVLPTGATREFHVAFEPEVAFDQSADVMVFSNDPNRGGVLVELFGDGAVPELVWDPNPLDFGGSYVGCTKEQTLELANIGADVAEVYDISGVGGVFELGDVPAMPFTLEPGESVQMSVDFSPSAVDEYTGSVIVSSSEPAGTRTGTHTGEGKLGPTHEDVWEIPDQAPTDIIFYVDQSRSMEDDQDRLAENFATFISEISSYSDDWQIMVVNDDDGCSNSGILTPSTASYVSRFESAVQSGGGDYTEAGLTVTSRAVSEAMGDGCNSGFMRPDAMLHIILVSDEPEQSPSSWITYVYGVQDMKGSKVNVRYSAIAGLVPDGCDTAEPGVGYYESVIATDGAYLDICSDWSSTTNLAQLAQASFNMDAFELSEEPLPSSIVVAVDGVVVDSGSWDYDEADNKVTITDSDSIPTGGQTVTIEYAEVAVCD